VAVAGNRPEAGEGNRLAAEADSRQAAA
jgi:hypothetical protein